MKHIKYNPAQHLARQALYHVQNVTIYKKLFHIPCRIISNFYKENHNVHHHIKSCDQIQNLSGTSKHPLIFPACYKGKAYFTCPEEEETGTDEERNPSNHGVVFL